MNPKVGESNASGETGVKTSLISAANSGLGVLSISIGEAVRGRGRVKKSASICPVRAKENGLLILGRTGNISEIFADATGCSKNNSEACLSLVVLIFSPILIVLIGAARGTTGTSSQSQNLPAPLHNALLVRSLVFLRRQRLQGGGEVEMRSVMVQGRKFG
jgi:hypothetical protein